MPDNVKRSIEGLSFLSLFPPFMQNALVEDEAFRKLVGVKLDATVLLNPGEVKFRRSSLFAAIRTLYKSSQLTANCSDEVGQCWILSGEEKDGHFAINLACDEKQFFLPGFAALASDRERRIREFDLALFDAGLPEAGLPYWREILEERSLEDEEVNQLDTELMRTPISWARVLEQHLLGPTGEMDTLVPPYREYYERLCGAGDAMSAEGLALEVVPRLVHDLLAWSRLDGARMSLLLASHSSIIPNSGLSGLSLDEIRTLAAWALHEGDLISKIGMIELGLEMLPNIPEIALTLQGIIEQILELDSDDRSGRLQLSTSLFVFIDGELSRTKILSDWPPFRRRFAALAQAALCERYILGRVDIAHFTEWALRERGHRYYLQSLVDLRIEPRWLPEYAVAEQFKNELIGRVQSASNRFINNIPEGPLRVLLTGDEPSGLVRRLNFPGSFLPGPLEGDEFGVSTAMPDEFVEILDQSLGTNRLEVGSVIALINLRGLFPISSDKVERAILLIREARHRFDNDLDIETRDVLMSGLAGVASVTRNSSLADEVRMMVRKNRIDGASPLDPKRELIIALIAAAAHKELDAWIRFVGDWGMELALSVKSKDNAAALSAEFYTLCIVEPALRKTLGRALVAVQSYLDV